MMFFPQKKIIQKSTDIGGFTLVELMVAVTLFTATFIAISGSFLSIIDAYKKVTSERVNVDNLSFAVESMVRGLKTGTAFHCGAGGVGIGLPQDCPFGNTYLAFKDATSDQIVYQFVPCPNVDPLCGRVQRSDDGGASFYPLTDIPTITQITTLKFYVVGNTPLALPDPTGDVEQPKVIILMKGQVGSDPRRLSTFDLQTIVTQRKPDLL
jgi:type II secretory pathway pseudopilin PulG